MGSNEKNSLTLKCKKLIDRLVEIKEQSESLFLMGYEDFVKATSDGYLINWVNIGSTKKLRKDTQKLILERVKKYKNNAITNNFLDDNIYYEDVIRGILEQEGIIVEVLCSKPYVEAFEYIKSIIENISDEEINNYIAHDKERNAHKLLIRRL